MTSFIFYVISIILVIAAIGVMRVRDVFRAGLLLILSFFAVAVIYITLNADFLAGVQVLIYVGGIGILLMFAIQLTQNIETGNTENKFKMSAFIVAIIFMGTMMYVVLAQDWQALRYDVQFDADHTPSVVRQLNTGEVEEVQLGVLMPDNLLMEDENGNPILNEDGEQEMESVQGSTEYIADALFNKDNGFVLPFEIASVLLLAALIGAIVVVRNKDGT